MAGIFLLFTLIACSVAWQTRIFYSIFSNELVRSVGYGAGSSFISGLLWFFGLGLVTTYERIEKDRTNPLVSRFAVIASAMIPCGRLALRPYEGFVPSNSDLIFAVATLFMMLLSTTTMLSLMGRLPNQSWEITERELSVGSRREEFSFVRAVISYAVMTYIVVATIRL